MERYYKKKVSFPNNFNLDDIKKLQILTFNVIENNFTQRTTLYEFVPTYNLKKYYIKYHFFRYMLT